MTFEKLNLDEAATRGILFSAKEDDTSGELRARLSACGIDVTITQVAASGWQRSHSHERVVEITHVISGKAFGVEQLPRGRYQFVEHAAGSHFSTTPGRSHNLYVCAGTVLSTIKLNDDPNGRDWIADSAMDQHLQTWYPTEDAILAAQAA